MVNVHKLKEHFVSLKSEYSASGEQNTNPGVTDGSGKHYTLTSIDCASVYCIWPMYVHTHITTQDTTILYSAI